MTPLQTLVIVLLGGFAAVFLVRAVTTTLGIRRLGGASGQREHDLERVASYLAIGAPESALIPERAWRDLDMDEVFERIDRTASWPGQHLLYTRLRREDHSFDALRRFEQGVNRLTDDPSTLQRIRAALRPLDERPASSLPTLFDGTLPALPRYARALALLSAGAVICAIGAIVWRPLIFAFLAIVLANLFVRPWIGLRIAGAIPAMKALPAFSRAATAIGALQVPELERQTAVLQRGAPRLRAIARAARWLAFEPKGAAEMAAYLFAYVNLLLLLDISAFVWSEAAMREHRDTLRAMYEALGEIDAMQSVATLRGELARWTRPVFQATARRELSIDAVTHPLLDDAVANSVEMRGRSMLLTGSNMSGKSTFIRTVGVNAILARTIHTVFGTGWRAPRWGVRTSIGRNDSLSEGTSYYRAEVNAVGALLARGDDEPCLLLIDELFRGTNSVERIAAAKAVLGALDARGDLVIVATHDVDLIPLLPEYESHHFREEVRDGALHFDYRLHDGPSSTRNALAILELAGYPADVVAEARRTADLQERRAAGSSAAPAESVGVGPEGEGGSRGS